jgi:hypothetical protein
MRGNSSDRKAPKRSVSMPGHSTTPVPSKKACTAGSSRVSRSAAASRATTAGGVRARTKAPAQARSSAPGKPASRKAGTSGTSRTRSKSVAASARSHPSRRRGAALSGESHAALPEPPWAGKHQPTTGFRYGLRFHPGPRRCINAAGRSAGSVPWQGIDSAPEWR